MYLSDVKRLEREYMSEIYRRAQVDIVKGNSATCYDGEDREYIDFTSGGGVGTLGFSHPGWIKGVTSQIETMPYASNNIYTRPQVQLAKMLCEHTGMRRTVFSNSGAEANEVALQAAQLYQKDKTSKVLVLEGSYHGSTWATSMENPNFVSVAHNDIADLQAKATDEIAGILLECIQVRGGVRPLSNEFADEIKKSCEEKDILLLVDEVGTGLGRTGRFLCSSYYGFVPDCITLAGGLGGGLPIGVTLLGDKLKDTLALGDYSSTFGGNPVTAVGAKAVIDSINGKLLDEVSSKGNDMAKEIASFSGVSAVSGRGLLLGISLEEGFLSEEIVDLAISHGVLLLAAGSSLRLLPSLTITNHEMKQGLKALEQTLADYKKIVERRKEKE